MAFPDLAGKITSLSVGQKRFSMKAPKGKHIHPDGAGFGPLLKWMLLSTAKDSDMFWERVFLKGDKCQK